MAELGVETLIITNAAGALNPLFDVGSIMVLADQINFTGTNPLIGKNHDPWGPRFPDMSNVFSRRLQKLALKKSRELSLKCVSGIYIGVHGPVLETPAETRAFRNLGADAVGMSTIMETIAARHMGLNILAFSCLTNKNLPDAPEEVTLDHVIAAAEKTACNLKELLKAVVPEL